MCITGLVREEKSVCVRAFVHICVEINIFDVNVRLCARALRTHTNKKSSMATNKMRKDGTISQFRSYTESYYYRRRRMRKLKTEQIRKCACFHVDDRMIE